MAKKIDELGKVTPATGDTYVIYDASTGDAATVDVILPMGAATASVAGTAGTVPASGVGQQNRILSAGAAWIEQNAQGVTPNCIQEFGMIECSSGAWDAKTLTLGGMTFKWSQAAISGGNLTMIRAAGITKGQASCGQTVRKFVGGTVTGADSLNENIWSTTSANIGASVTMGAAYQTMQYELFTRGVSDPCHWSIKVFHTGSNSLFISGTYIGQKIT